MAMFQNFNSAWGTPDHNYDTDYNLGGSDAPWGYGQSPQSSYPGAPFSGANSGYNPGYDAYWGGKGRQTLLRGNLGRGVREQHGHFTLKVPPYWEPADEKWYPYHVWIRDLDLWCAQTELAVPQRAPAVCSRVGGTAKDMIRFFDTQILRDGRTDGQGQAIETGPGYMICQFDARYKTFDIETSTHAIIMLLQFRSGGRCLSSAPRRTSAAMLFVLRLDLD